MALPMADDFTPRFIVLYAPEWDVLYGRVFLCQSWLGGLKKRVLSRAQKWPVGTRNLLWL